MSVYERLEALKISLPPVEPPVAAFVPAVRAGNLLFVSGHIAKKDGKPWAGKLGVNLVTAQGMEAASGIVIELLPVFVRKSGESLRQRFHAPLPALLQNSGSLRRCFQPHAAPVFRLSPPH